MKTITRFISLPAYTSASTNSKIPQENLLRLQKVLENHGIEKKDIQGLLAIVKSEMPDVESRQLGEKVNDWILTIFGKIVNGEGRIDRTLTANFIATLIKQYYGINT